MKRTTLVGSLLFVTLLSSGCATLFSPQPQAVPVSSQPAGAEVFVNGEAMGLTPVTLTLDARQSYEVTLRLAGEERTLVLKSELDGAYIALDVLPGVGLAAASLIVAGSCSGGLECLGGVALGATGVGIGLGSAAIASATDAVTGAWFYLTPGEIIVTFD